MLNNIETLRVLHRVHRQLADLRDRIEKGPRQVRACQANVDQQEEAFAAIKERMTQTRMASDQKQLQLKACEEKIVDLKTKLNLCKSNREFQALKEQIAADEMATSVLSDEILESLENVDQLQIEVQQAELAVDKARQQLLKTEQAVETEREGLLGDVGRLEADLKVAEKSLSSDFREIYQRVIQARGADGMAPVEGESCSGCFHHITPNNYNNVCLGHVVCCGNCGRLLYLPEDRTTAQPK